jgi:hypothetical protein
MGKRPRNWNVMVEGEREKDNDFPAERASQIESLNSKLSPNIEMVCGHGSF